MSKKNLITEEGYKQLQEELEYLKTVKRLEVAEKIEQAKEFGDLSENSEYDAAIEEQGKVESRISELQEILKNIEIVKVINNDKINMGSTVKLLCLDNNNEYEVKLVSKNEVKIFEGKISINSPLGKALMNKKVNDIVTVKSETLKTYRYKILSIN